MPVRRVRRIIRKIDPWTVLKVSFVLNTIGAFVFVLGVWVAWSIAVQRGIPDAFVDLFLRLTIVVSPDGELYFRVVVMLAIVGVIMMTAIMTLAAVLYNLTTDVVGGIELIMLEETYESVHIQTAIQPPAVLHVPATNGNLDLTAADTVEHS
ncbi:MAG: hypothetical protein BMS9Abin12_0829 [Acidimicrobiia bacterium]|nr:MAG: hypothetical protein BMS9Abin12_0829 [Acidimicrobiia bacterium]